MKKRFLSLLCVLALCLGLLTVTALAAGEDAPDKLYVGNQSVRNGDNTTYWTTNDSGELTQSNEDGTWNVKYDPGTATLTLNEAKISGSYDENNNPFTAGIYAKGSSNQAVALTIELIGTNTITGRYGIYLDGHQGNTICTNASVLIKNGNESGESGSLTVNGTGSLGIYILSGTGNASLTIENASVVANATSSYSGSGVCVQSGANSQNSPGLSLTVNGGSLTTSGSASGEGIKFYVGAYEATSATTSLTVTDNAIVDARTGGISADGVNITPIVNIGSTGSTGGIVFDGSEGTVYGEVTLDENLTIGEGETLTIGKDASLTVPEGKTITVESGGKLDGTPTGSGTVKIAPTITTESLPDGEVGAVYSQTLTATGDPTITWSVTSGTLPAGLTLESSTGVISGTPTTAGQSDFTVKATNSAGVASKQFSVTIKSVPVANVSLNESNLSLHTGETATLTATVEPDNATNKNVTWSSNNADVATVEGGTVTALKPGTATITATADGVAAKCTVTVSREPVIPDPNGITVTQPANGTIKVNPSNGSAGTLITVTATPDEGYELAYITVDGEKISGNTFRMPDKAVTVSAVFVPESFPFVDVRTGDWFYDYVAYVYSNGLMDGTSATTFEPNANMTRAMVWTILARIDGETVTGANWIDTARAWAMAEGVSDGTDPNGLVTREQFATMLYRYAVAKGYDVSIGESTNILSYADYDEISEWAIPAMQWACGSGIITGVTESTLVPKGTATRAQCAAMLMRFVEL